MMISLVSLTTCVLSLVKVQADKTVKATDENLASEDWALNIEVCDKVTGDGSNG